MSKEVSTNEVPFLEEKLLKESFTFSKKLLILFNCSFIS